MEDDSLDDFFAKKDKSKKKGKAKVTPGDILAKQEEKPKKKLKRKKEEKEGGQETSEDRGEKDSTKNPKPEDEEWVDYEQVEKDYSGLRIQTLQIRDENSDDDKDTRDSGDEDGEEGEKGEGSKGPWNKGSSNQNASAAAAAAAAVVQEDTPPPEPRPETPKEDAPAQMPRKYVPPGARAAASAPSGPTPLRRGGKKNAPNIQSEEDFPTLGGGPVEAPESNLSSFERVRGGGRQMEDERSKGLKLQLGNKFASLGE